MVSARMQKADKVVQIGLCNYISEAQKVKVTDQNSKYHFNELCVCWGGVGWGWGEAGDQE